MPSSDVTIYFNANCSKCRGAMDLLSERGIDPTVVRYLETPPSASELKEVLGLLGMRPRELLRTGEAAYKDAGLDDRSLTDDQVVEAMVEHPILIERPIVIADGRAIVGRPPARILEILDSPV